MPDDVTQELNDLNIMNIILFSLLINLLIIAIIL